MSTVERAPRKCSMCRQEGCNKNKPTCPARIEMSGNSCSQCHRDGCTVLTCPVKREIHHHHLIANLDPMRFLTRLSTYVKLINPNLFDHVTEITLKEQYIRDLLEKIKSIYTQKIAEAIQNSRAPVQVPPDPPSVPARPRGPAAPVLPQKRIRLLSGYKPCTEECGVCYDKTCEVTFNCDHQVCFDCFNGIKELKKPAMICPFCRGDIENVQAGNRKSRANLAALKP